MLSDTPDVWNPDQQQFVSTAMDIDHHPVKPVAPDKLFAILNAMPRK